MGERLRTPHIELVSVVSCGNKVARVVKNLFGVYVIGKTLMCNASAGFTVTSSVLSVHGEVNIGSVEKAIKLAEEWVNK